MNEERVVRWLPVRYIFTPTAIMVKWMDFGSSRFVEPFFHQTVQSLKSNIPPTGERTTGLGTLLDAARDIPSTLPAGIIFHISRCGSTLLANVLKTADNVLVLSESSSAGMLFARRAFINSPFPPEGHDEARAMLLDCVVRLYAANPSGGAFRLVIKCHAASLMQIAAIRSIWPTVPFVVVIRNPAEVIVSNLTKPAGWVRCRQNPAHAHALFGWAREAIERMSIEEYCARGIGQFCSSAMQVAAKTCKVLDYDQIDPETIHGVAKFFEMELPTSDNDFKKTLNTYAKDPRQMRRFAGDHEQKVKLCTREIEESVRRWSWKEYSELKALSMAHNIGVIAPDLDLPGLQEESRL